MGVFIGLDVSLSKTAVCVVDRDGVVLRQGKVASEPGPLVARLAEWSGVIDLAGIEACPLSEWLHRGLREAGIPVSARFACRLAYASRVNPEPRSAHGFTRPDSRHNRCSGSDNGPGRPGTRPQTRRIGIKRLDMQNRLY
jgi:hypothetical protein